MNSQRITIARQNARGVKGKQRYGSDNVKRFYHQSETQNSENKFEKGAKYTCAGVKFSVVSLETRA